MRSIFILTFILLSLFGLKAQEVTENVKMALATGSSKELLKYFNDITEISVNDKSLDYSKMKAEKRMKFFFQNYPPSSFIYIHKGTSPEGLKYNIGMYSSKVKNFRVVILLKQKNGNYVIDRIKFKES